MAGEKTPRRIGQYEILGELGEGAMGKVYKAVQPSLNRVVAIKVLPEEFLDDEKRVERFNREAQAVALINHANVVQIIDRDEEDHHVYFVMEYVPGMALDALMEKRRLSLREALIVIKAVCKGLEAAHQKSVVHRDLNPRNVLISEDLTTVKVADFGISRVESISRSHGTLSTSEVSMGTLHYIAPEQATDMATADHRADIYSLGVLLYEMLTGRVPVGRFNLPSQLNTEVPSGIDPIVLKCLSADPEERYASAGAVLTDIRKLEDRLRLGLAQDLEGISKSTSKILRRSTSTLRARERSWLPIAGGVAGIGLVAALAIGWLARKPAPELPTAPADPVADTRMAVEIPNSPRYSPVEGPTAELTLAEDFEIPTPPEDGDIGDEIDESTAETEAVEADEPEPDAASVEVAEESTPAPDPTAATIAKALEVARQKYEADLYDPALGDLEALIAEHGNHASLAHAYLLRGQIEQSKREYDQSLASYVETQTRYPRSAAAAESAYRQARLLVELGGRDRRRQGIDVAASVAEQWPRSPWAPQALLLAAETQQDTRAQFRDNSLNATVPAALPLYRQLADRYPGTQGAERALWELGDMYEEIKRFELAAGAFEKLARSFPSTRYDAWWRLARIYDRKLDDPSRAVTAYENVPNTSPQYGDAQKRISKLAG